MRQSRPFRGHRNTTGDRVLIAADEGAGAAGTEAGAWKATEDLGRRKAAINCVLRRDERHEATDRGCAYAAATLRARTNERQAQNPARAAANPIALLASRGERRANMSSSQ